MEVVRLRPEQVPEAAQVLARAFHGDPAWVWVIPDAERRAATLPWLFRVGFDDHVGRPLDDAGAHPRRRAVAAARARADARVAALRALVATPIRLRDATAASSPTGAPSRRSARGSRRGRTGTSPGSASTRPTSAAASAAAARARDRRAPPATRIPAVLLTNNEDNLSFYGAHGFEVVAEGRTPDRGPAAWALVRNP